MESISERQQRHFSTDIKFLEEKSSLQHTLVERKGDLCYQPRITNKEVAALNNVTPKATTPWNATNYTTYDRI